MTILPLYKGEREGVNQSVVSTSPNPSTVRRGIKALFLRAYSTCTCKSILIFPLSKVERDGGNQSADSTALNPSTVRRGIIIVLPLHKAEGADGWL
jgi:hypothetical protein